MPKGMTSVLEKELIWILLDNAESGMQEYVMTDILDKMTLAQQDIIISALEKTITETDKSMLLSGVLKVATMQGWQNLLLKQLDGMALSMRQKQILISLNNFSQATQQGLISRLVDSVSSDLPKSTTWDKKKKQILDILKVMPSETKGKLMAEVMKSMTLSIMQKLLSQLNIIK